MCTYPLLCQSLKGKATFVKMLLAVSVAILFLSANIYAKDGGQPRTFTLKLSKYRAVAIERYAKNT